jgi:cytochrome c oxidase subunit 2
MIVVWIFWQGFTGYLDLQTPPANAYEVQVLGQKWKWLFTYPNGVVDDNLHVPPAEPVRLVMTSQDVIHSLYVPDFRIKRDALPGRYERQWFEAPEPGEYQLFCAEYCGTSHSGMIAKVIVHRSRPEFEAWLAEAGNFLDKLPPEKLWEGGQKLYNQRGCKQCHSVDGVSGIGPSFKGIWGHNQPLKGGGSVVVEENYVRESIVNPQAKIVAGYEPVMPTYQGRLKDKEITAIIEYLKTLE